MIDLIKHMKMNCMCIKQKMYIML